jgi:hypothetical protein
MIYKLAVIALLCVSMLGAQLCATPPEKFLFDGVSEKTPIYAGWEASTDATARFIQTTDHPYLSQLNASITGTGQGKTVLLWKSLEKATGKPYEPHFQLTGDCVSHAYGSGIDVLTAIQMYQTLIPQRWVAFAATEPIYGGGRIQINGRPPAQGMNGVDAARYIQKYGVLLRQKYFNGKYDFRQYDVQKATQLGRQGVPLDLLQMAKLHPVQTIAIVRSWAECRDAIANGYPVIMCSNIGFRYRNGRDKDGFLTPGGTWYHAMLIAGIDDSGKRPSALVINSWGSEWVSGPKRLGQPEGSFWVDASVIDRAMKQGDSIAISGYIGYPVQDLDYQVW